MFKQSLLGTFYIHTVTAGVSSTWGRKSKSVWRFRELFWDRKTEKTTSLLKTSVNTWNYRVSFTEATLHLDVFNIRAREGSVSMLFALQGRGWGFGISAAMWGQKAGQVSTCLRFQPWGGRDGGALELLGLPV